MGWDRPGWMRIIFKYEKTQGPAAPVFAYDYSLLVPFKSVETIIMGVTIEPAMFVCMAGTHGIKPRVTFMLFMILVAFVRF